MIQFVFMTNWDSESVKTKSNTKLNTKILEGSKETYLVNFEPEKMLTFETKLAHSKEDSVSKVIEKVKHTENKELIRLQTGLQLLNLFNVI